MPMHLKSTLIKEPLDTPQHAPTKQNILNAFERITQYSQPGDVVFLHYSGHGSRLPDQDGDEEDGYGKSKQVSLDTNFPWLGRSLCPCLQMRHLSQ